MNMEFGFIHIGMMKTASTYVQNIWFNDKSYATWWLGNNSFLQTLRNQTLKNDIDKEIPLNLKTDQVYQKGQKLVVSSEAFSTAFLNGTQHQQKIPSFIEYTSRNLGRLSDKTQNLLVMIREPVSWIKSIYIQSIKQGQSGSAQNFVEKQIVFLKHSLNLDHIINCYQRYFGNILILPYELFKADEDIFWQVISHSFDVPVVQKQNIGVVNRSFGLKKVYLLSKLNETSNFIINTLQTSKTYNNIKEKQHLTSTYADSGVWTHRRFVEFADDQSISELYSLFNIQTPKDDFLDFKIPAELMEAIQCNYINFLKNNILPEYPDYYEHELQKKIAL